MGDPSIGRDILIDMKDDYKEISKTGLDIGSSYYFYLGQAYLELGKDDKAIKSLLKFEKLFNKLVQEKSNNEFHLWTVVGKRMAGKTLLAIAYAKNKNGKESLDIIESIVSEIKDQPRLFYENSIEILYNLAEAYEILGKLEESKSYYKQALNEMNRIAVNLNNEHRYIFLKNNKINNNMSFQNS